ACACARLRWKDLSPTARQAVEAAEAFADDPGAFAAMRAVGEALKSDFYSRAALICTRAHGSAAALPAMALVRPAEDAVAVLHCLFGIPHCELAADPAWQKANDGAAVRLARAIYLNHSFDQMPILADALEDAGCTHPDVVAHCRDGKTHWRG